MKIEGFTKTYGKKTLRFLTMHARKRIVLITGANGSGKTTFLRCLSRTLQTDCGFSKKPFILMINGSDLPSSLRVKDYLSMLLAFEKNASRLKTLIGHFHIEPFMNKPIKALSKGMAQRVALVATFMHGEGAVLLDEPMQGLDPLYKKSLVQWMNQTKRVCIVATHETETYEILDSEVYHFESPDPL